MKLLTGLVLFGIVLAPAAMAWGPIGHRVVGQIGESHLNKKALKKVRTILASESLAIASTWADFIKSDPSWQHSREWHYVNIRKGKNVRDANAVENGKLLWALEHFSKAVKSPKTSPEEKVQALRFLVHFVGDMHMPLHVGYKSDRGGGRFPVKFLGEKTDMHTLWDHDLPNFQRLSYTEYAASINHATPKQVKEWQSSTFEDWAQESWELTQKIYPKRNAKLGFEYNFQYIGILNERLLKAGVRLGGLLNRIFD